MTECWVHLEPNHEPLPLHFTERNISVLLLEIAADIGSFSNLRTTSGPEKQKGGSPVLSYSKKFRPIYDFLLFDSWASYTVTL